MKEARIKIKDLQFPRHFLINEVDLDANLIQNILEQEIEVRRDGEADTIDYKDGKIVASNPSSITRFIFNILYSTLTKYAMQDSGGIHQDKLGLGLLFMCKQYVYTDFSPKDLTGPPVLVNFNKLPVPSFIVRELVEPIVGKISDCPILFMPCKFTDVIRPIDSLDHLISQYNLSEVGIGYDDFPLLLSNCKIYNSAAQMCHLTVKFLELTIGEEKTKKVIRKIILDDSSNLIGELVLILRMLHGEPDFVIDFMEYFTSNVSLNREEKVSAVCRQKDKILADNYLNKHIKTATPTRTPIINKQWSQWSMIMGLIEKQLSPMRGSMWPTSENVKPFEDRLRGMQIERSKREKKKMLNFEELLETYRDLYNHKAVEPGKIVEHMLRNSRVWKV